MNCALDFVNWIMEPEGPCNGCPTKSILSHMKDERQGSNWTGLDREDVADLLKQPWLIFLNVSELGDPVAVSDPDSGYFRAGDVAAFLGWLVARGIARQEEADILLAKYTLGLMEE